MEEEKRSLTGALPLTVCISHLTFEGSYGDPETDDLIKYYIECAGGGRVNVRLEDRIATYFLDDRGRLQQDRRHHNKEMESAVRDFERREKDLGHAPKPLSRPDEPSE